MTDFSKRFQEGLAAARRSVPMKIRKHAGDVEDFDPETLLYSLIEAEIPFKHIFLLCDRIVDRLVVFVQNDLKEITEEQLHGLVTKAISAHPDSEAPVWLSNYHNAYALDGDGEHDDGDEAIGPGDPARLVPARKASLIRGLIKGHLARELNVTDEQLTELIDSLALLGEDIQEATTRILKFIRFTGMVEVRQSMLRLFVEDLLLRSQKKFIHRGFQDDEELKMEIAVAERSFEAARKQCDTDLFKARTEFQFALELLGRIFLTSVQLTSCPARQHSFQYLLSLLRALDHKNLGNKVKEQLPSLVVERVNSALTPTGKDTRYQIRMLREATETLAIMSETLADAADALFTEGTSADPLATVSKTLAFDKGASAFQTILYTARSLQGSVTGRKQIVNALRAPTEERTEKVCDAAVEFIREELQLSCDKVASSSGIVLRVRDLARLKTRADCLRHGRDVLLLFRFGYTSERLSRAHVNDFLVQVMADPTCFGIILSDQERDSDFRKELNQLSQSTRRVIIWMDTNTSTSLFHHREKFLETIDGTLKRGFPWLDESEDSEMIPTAITGYVREFVAVLNKLEGERNWNEIRAQIGPFLEEIASDYKHYFYQQILSPLRSMTRRERLDIENRLLKLMAGGMLGMAVEFANLCLSLPPQVVSLPFKMRLEAFKDFVERVKPHRNKLAHNIVPASEVWQALNVMIQNLGKLMQAAPYPSLYLCLPSAGGKLIATPLFGATESYQAPSMAHAGLVLAVWNAGSAQELALPKMLKPNRDDPGAVSLTIDLVTVDLAGPAKGQGRILPVLLRTLRNTVTRFEETSKETEAPMPQGALIPLSTWLLDVMSDADSNSLAAELIANLGRYDQKQAIAAAEAALRYASNELSLQVEITLNDHRLTIKGDSEERIVCSIFDQAGLLDSARVQEEIEYWARARTTGHFVFLFANPIQYQEDIRRFKQETQRLNASREFYAWNRILEPKHTYFLLQFGGLRLVVEKEPSRGPGGESGGDGSIATKPADKNYDVFICYNSQDRDEVREVVNQLRESGIEPWFDDEDLRPGSRWQVVLQEQLRHVTSAAIFVGKSGFSSWQREEISVILRNFNSLGQPVVIPVILSNGSIEPSATGFLENYSWVDFRTSSPPPLEKLIWGITGIRSR